MGVDVIKKTYPVPTYYTTDNIVLNDLTWTHTTAGSYWAPVDLSSVLPPCEIIAVSISYYAALRDTDNIDALITQSLERTVVIYSSTDTFYSNSSKIKVRVVHVET